MYSININHNPTSSTPHTLFSKFLALLPSMCQLVPCSHPHSAWKPHDDNTHSVHAFKPTFPQWLWHKETKQGHKAECLVSMEKVWAFLILSPTISPGYHSGPFQGQIHSQPHVQMLRSYDSYRLYSFCCDNTGVNSSETPIYQTTRCHIPKDSNLHQYQ